MSDEEEKEEIVGYFDEALEEVSAASNEDAKIDRISLQDTAAKRDLTQGDASTVGQQRPLETGNQMPTTQQPDGEPANLQRARSSSDRRCLRIWVASIVGWLVISSLLLGILIVLIQNESSDEKPLGSSQGNAGLVLSRLPSLAPAEEPFTSKPTSVPVVEGTVTPTTASTKASSPLPLPSAEATIRPTATTAATVYPSLAPETQNPSVLSNQTRLESFIDFVLQYASNRVQLDFTPQYQAAAWIANEDPMPHILPTRDRRLLQRWLMATFYFATSGDAWTNDYGFLSSEDECLWNDGVSGVFCTGDMNLINIINIPSNNLRGTIPIDISILSQLEQISLSGNSLTRNIPTTLSYLPNLEVLELDHNNFSGRLDFLFSAARRRQLEAGSLFPRLRTLDLASNVLEGSLPESVGMLSFLQILSLEGNTLTGSVATDLSQLSLLNVLSLANNDFDDTLNDILFRRMSQLQYLDLSGNFFRGNLAVLDSLQPLLLLDLSNNMIEGPIPQTLPPNLTTLLLNGNVLTGEIPSSIGLSTKLENMDLSMNELSGEIPLALFRLTTLRSLFLSRNPLVGTLPPYFLNLQFLQELSLRNTNLIGTIPFELPPKLELLDLSENEMTGEIPTLPTSLRFLLLNRNQFVGSIPTSLSQLTNLNLLYLQQNPALLPTSLNPICQVSPDLMEFVADCATSSTLDSGGSSTTSGACSCCSACCVFGSSSSATNACPDTVNANGNLAHLDLSYSNGFERTSYVFSETVSFES